MVNGGMVKLEALNIQYKTNDVRLEADMFIDMANKVWAGTYNLQ